MTSTLIVDTSALFAILLDEEKSAICRAALADCERALVSAGTVAESRIVAVGRNLVPDFETLTAGYGFEIVPVTAQTARAVGEAYARWGRGVHPAKLNFGDCFAYALAMERGLPLLYVGEDFAQTDVRSALVHP
jgi:ribonuclease VapC